MANPEKLITLGTQYKEKHKTICVGHHYVQTKTNNVVKDTIPPVRLSTFENSHRSLPTTDHDQAITLHSPTVSKLIAKSSFHRKKNPHSYLKIKIV